ncbi:hypothetical protein N7470_004829 [Penicillium chermesinum]|nr:hypothetical protein N7470_004829 [Penicillium chermesinum]
MPRKLRARHANRVVGNTDRVGQANSVLVPQLPAIEQTECPLFTILPAEIRNHIYALSLESDDRSKKDPDSLYQRHAFYYRPGYKQPRCIPTALLQTCQQIYLEASLLPAAVNEHTFWFYRAPPHVKNATSPVAYFQKMSPEQRAQVSLSKTIIGTVSSGELKIGDNDERGMRSDIRIAPKKMTITLRHTDWWLWENDDPLGIDPFRQGRTHAAEMGNTNREYNPRAWGNRFMLIPTLNELVIEFETVLRKRNQLDSILQMAHQWKFPMDVEKHVYLVADPSTLRAYTWVGATEDDLQMQGSIWRVIPSPPVGPETQPDTALAGQAAANEAPLSPTLRPFETTSEIRTVEEENSEKYYVVYLTWRKQVVEG